MSAKPGDVITKIAVRVVFDAYFERVIVGSHLEQLPRANRQSPITYRVREALPRPDMYRELRNQRFTASLEDLLSAAQSEVETLAGELRDWHDNLPEGINSSDKAAEIDEAASTLENINFPEIPDGLCDIKVLHLPSLEQDSRSKRGAEVVSKLEDAIGALNSKLEDLRQAIDDAKKPEGDASEARDTLRNPMSDSPSANSGKDDEPDPQEKIAEIESLVSDLEDVKGELENVAYPSMM